MAIPKTNFEPSEATKIKRALSKRFKHPNESTIFFEVKNGPTYYSNNLLIMDAVAIKKSWKNPCFSVFEIKTSRGDFLNDEK